MPLTGSKPHTLGKRGSQAMVGCTRSHGYFSPRGFGPDFHPLKRSCAAFPLATFEGGNKERWSRAGTGSNFTESLTSDPCLCSSGLNHRSRSLDEREEDTVSHRVLGQGGKSHM